MNVSRIVSLAAAVAISAIQWTAFFNPAHSTPSALAISTPATGDQSDESLPVVVITARRQPWAHATAYLP